MFVTVYVDDMMIYYDTFDQYIEHVITVFQLLEDYELHSKDSKCELFKREVPYCGYIIVADIDVSGPSGSADAGATGGTNDVAGRILLSMGRSAEALGGSPMAWAAHGEGSEVTGGVSDGGSDPGAIQPMDGPP